MTNIFISEIHYDNTGSDANEGIEITGPANTNLAGWSLILYNGNNRNSYNTRILSGIIPNQQNNFGSLFFSYPANGIQNGPDAIALVDNNNKVIQFLSYEGTFTAANGPAIGLTSINIGVSQNAAPIGQSLQLIGTGTTYADFTWTSATNSYGTINTGQTFPLPISPGITITETANSTNVNEENQNTDTYNISLNTTPTGLVEITISAASQIEISKDGVNFLNSITLNLTTTNPQTITVRAINDSTVENSPHTGILTHSITNSADPAYSNTLTAIPNLQINITDNDIALTGIYNIQGNNLTSPLVNQSVTTQGIVVGDFQLGTQLNGFYIQDINGDGDPTTSDGIFIFAPNSINVNIGDIVQLTGTVFEFANQTQISNLTALKIIGSGTITPTQITLPFVNETYLERYEGMLVQLPQTLTITDTFNLPIFGEMLLSNGRLFNPTNVVEPGAEAISLQAQNNLNKLILDDGSSIQNPDPIPYPSPGLTASNTLRTGTTTTNLTGILSDFNAYRLNPTQTPIFNPTNPRPATPPNMAGSLKVASFNLLNYFNGDGNGAGFPTSRGANSISEFQRQHDKIISAISGLNADIIGLMEIENDGYETNSAIQNLINGLNAVAGANTYAFINPGLPQLGYDEIAVGLIYRPDKIIPIGTPTTLNTGAFLNSNRQPLVQTFQEIATGEKFTIAVNHFKSKSTANLATGADIDQGDGQGAWNATRTQAAIELTNWLATDPTRSGDTDFLIIGDLNSYAKEDPIKAIKNAGYSNLIEQFVGNEAYSYLFQGQAGTLDYAFANSTLASQVAGASKWHINADEPSIFDYNEELKTANQIYDLYNNSPYRSSDHDPLILGLNLSTPNRVPVAVNDTYNTNEDTDLIISVNNALLANDSDADNDVLKAVLVEEPNFGTLTLNQDGSFSYSPFNNFHGTDSFSYRLNDGAAESEIANVNITVSSINDSPKTTAILSNQNATENSFFEFTFPTETFSDADGDELTYSASLENGQFLPNWLTFNPTKRTFIGIPSQKDLGAINIKISATDGRESVTNSFTIIVKETPNTPPTVNTPLSDIVIVAGTPFSLKLPENIFVDADGDPLTYSLTLSDGNLLPDWLNFDVATLSLSGIPPENFRESLRFLLTAKDSAGASVSNSFNLLLNYPTPTETPAPTEASTPTLTETPAPTETSTPTPTPTPTETSTPTPTPAPTETSTPTPAPAPTETSTLTPTPTPTETFTPTPAPTETFTPTPAPTETSTLTPTPTPTETFTPTPASTETFTPTPAPTETSTLTPTPTETFTPTPTPTPASTETFTPTPTPTPASTETFTPTPTPTPASTETFTPTPTPTPGVFAYADVSCLCDIFLTPSNFISHPTESTLNGSLFDDFITGTDNRETINCNLGNDIILGKGDNDNLLGDDDKDLIFGNIGNDYIDSGKGRDTVCAGKDNDVLLGREGNDILLGQIGNDTIIGGTENDLIFGNTDNDFIDSGEGEDLIFAGKNDDIVKSSAGNDTIFGNFNNDTICGGESNDILFGNSDFDILDGCEGEDTLQGGKDNDILIGGKDNDILDGDFGSDTLSGGLGNDRFILEKKAGMDIITDFKKGEDLLILSAGLTFQELIITADTNATIISTDSEQLATLKAVQPSLIDVSDFQII